MSIADLFESREHRANKGAFRNLVMIARSDGQISDEEMCLTERMGRFLGLTEVQVRQIMEQPEAYPMFPPSTIRERRERMVDLVRMVLADGEIDAREMATLHRLAIGLGYSEEDIPGLVNRIIHHLNTGKDREEVIEAMLAEQKR